MADLYQTLGVGKGASKDDIRKAYRKKSKTAHPDAGGSPESFALVKRAHDILTDEERRAKYDATGDESEKAPNNEISEVINIIAAVMDAVIMEAANRGLSPINVDIIRSMKSNLSEGIKKAEADREKIRSQIKKTEILLGRFTAKDGENFLEGIIAGKIAELNNQIAMIDKSLNAPRKALEMIGKFDFRFEKTDNPEQSGLRYFNVMSL